VAIALVSWRDAHSKFKHQTCNLTPISRVSSSFLSRINEENYSTRVDEDAGQSTDQYTDDHQATANALVSTGVFRFLLVLGSRDITRLAFTAHVFSLDSGCRVGVKALMIPFLARDDKNISSCRSQFSRKIYLSNR